MLSGAVLTSVVFLMKFVTILSIARPSAWCRVKSLKMWNLFPRFSKYMYVLFLGREVRIGSTTRGRGPYRPWAVLKTSGTVSSNADRPRPVNNIFISLFSLILRKNLIQTFKSSNLFYNWVFHSLS